MELSGPTGQIDEAEWAFCLNSHGPSNKLYVPLDAVESMTYCNFCRFMSYWKNTFFPSHTAQSHLTQEFICALILLDLPRGNDISGAWSCRPFCLLSQQALKMMKTKMCNKGRESACLATKQCVGPWCYLFRMSCVCVCLHGCRASEGKTWAVIGHRFSPPMKKGQVMWGVSWYLLSRQEELSFLQKNLLLC